VIGASESSWSQCGRPVTVGVISLTDSPSSGEEVSDGGSRG
jgi:hypothetical protein